MKPRISMRAEIDPSVQHPNYHVCFLKASWTGYSDLCDKVGIICSKRQLRHGLAGDVNPMWEFKLQYKHCT